MTAYGVDEFVSGLKNYVRRDLEFRLQVNQEVKTAVSEKRLLQNLCILPPITDGQKLAQLETQFANLMQRKSSPYDSQPGTARTHCSSADDQWHNILPMIVYLHGSFARCGHFSTGDDQIYPNEYTAVTRSYLLKGAPSGLVLAVDHA